MRFGKKQTLLSLKKVSDYNFNKLCILKLATVFLTHRGWYRIMSREYCSIFSFCINIASITYTPNIQHNFFDQRLGGGLYQCFDLVPEVAFSFAIKISPFYGHTLNGIEYLI